MKKVFVLERDKDIFDILSIVLTEEGYAIERADSIDHLDQLLSLSTPDAVLLDILSPFHREAEFCRRLKAGDGTKDLPIIVLTTNNLATDALSVVCADSVLSKPFDLVDLISIVHQHLPA